MASLMEQWKSDYSDMPLEEYAAKVHQKFYSDMSFEEFKAKALPGATMQKPEIAKYTPEQQSYLDQRSKAASADLGTLGDATLASQSAGTFGIGPALFDAASAIFDRPKDTGWYDTFQLNREARQKGLEAARERSPVATTLAPIAAGIGGAGAATNAVGNLAARGVPGAAAADWLLAPATGGLGSQVAKGALQGAVGGAAVAGGEGADMGDAAAIGGAIGGAIPAIGAGVKAVGTVGSNILRPMYDAKGFAADKWAEVAGSGAKTVDDIEQLAARKGLRPVDVAPESARDTLRAATNVPGPGRDRLTNQLGVEKLGANNRVERAITESIGDPNMYDDAVETATKTLKKNGDELFGAARKAKRPIDVTPVLDKIDNTIAPGVNRIVDPGSTIADDSVSATLARVRSKLASGKEQLADLEDLHLVKEDIDSLISKAKRAGDGTLVGKLMGVKTSLLKQMDDTNPLYGVARKTYAGDAAVKDAYETGLEYLSSKGGNLSPRQLAELSDAEREAFKIGLAKGAKNIVDQSPDGADLVKRLIGSKAKRDALDPLFASKEDKGKFYTAMLNEARRNRTRQAVIGGSTTARQLTTGQNAMIAPEDMVMDVATGGISGAVKAVFKRAAARAQGFTSKTADEFIKLATDRTLSGQETRRELLRLAQGRKDRYEALADMLDKVRRGSVGAVASGASSE
ncbi:MAG: hypothetical protein RJA36_2852 [Pseudomonadota bacterium]|jgi:hypothetical protein